MSDDTLPRCDSIFHTREPDFYLTHAIWRNSYGSCQPETGVRPVVNGEVQKDGFRLIQHNCVDFKFAEPIILRGLRKGWDACRISTFVEWLAKPCNRRRWAR